MKKAVSLMVAVGLVMTCCLVAFAAPAADAKKGEAVYAKNNCKVCHSIAGVGSPKSKLDGVGAKLTEDAITKWIRTPKEMNPKTTMMAYPVAKISDADLADLVAYMMTLKK
ncbi:MAG: cytochrome c [Acidobacteriia bacterium]|nr:cytochrome c [Terriglobia bacterium]